ncbi:hypothetical protein KRR26_29995 [Corallococcus sp. M34]|uniref:hypothetical protein n=1 Tax=Citreicoccus inhibens TaxID=2849499 RepID=UPI001C249CA0|nr:hypothetical protein [Citreicoccus inhibens]MBU8899851.1 hypothetical protein [Citreicoccus inhibens]
MPSQPPSQLALFDAPEPARAADPVRSRLPSREDALPLAAELARRMSAALGVPVHLRLTDNRATLVSYRRVEEGLRLRVHHLFLGAPEAVVCAMADYVRRGDSAAQQALEDYIHPRQGLLRRERRPGAPLRTRGRCFDLRAVAERLGATYFGGQVHVDLGWARKPARRKRRSIYLGGYDARLREIRIHPALDRPHVPAYVVDFLVFHAMLHADLAAPDTDAPSESGRCAAEHSPEFHAREAAFPLRDAAGRWLAENLQTLLRG